MMPSMSSPFPRILSHPALELCEPPALGDQQGAALGTEGTVRPRPALRHRNDPAGSEHKLTPQEMEIPIVAWVA